MCRSGYSDNVWKRLNLYVLEDLAAGVEAATEIVALEKIASRSDDQGGILSAMRAARIAAEARPSREATYANDTFSKITQDRVRVHRDREYETLYDLPVDPGTLTNDELGPPREEVARGKQLTFDDGVREHDSDDDPPTNDFGELLRTDETHHGFHQQLVRERLGIAVSDNDDEVPAFCSWELTRSGFGEEFWLNENNLNKAVREIQQVAGTSAMDENEQIHEMLIRHTTVEQDRGHGKQHQTVKYIDHETPENNDFFAINQFRVEGPVDVIKPDIVLFVNGIPLGVVECKSPQIPEPRSEALDQLTRYQNERDDESEGAEELFRYNQFSGAIWMEGGVMGTYRTPKDQYKPWRDAYPLEDDELTELFDLDGYLPDQYRMLFALFEPTRLLNQVRHFTVFENKQSGSVKMVASNSGSGT